MITLNMNTINLLEDDDKQKISYLASLLLKKEKYNHLKNELFERKNEIKNNQTLSHNEIWSNLDV
jgi:hypothetical protein